MQGFAEADQLRQAGLAVEVSARLPAAVRSFLFHIDVTDTSRFPQERGQAIELLQARAIRVLNAHVTDISKRAVHALAQKLGIPCALAARDGDARELLIVKINRNHGGRNERLLPRRYRRTLGLATGNAVIRGPLTTGSCRARMCPGPAGIIRTWWWNAS